MAKAHADAEAARQKNRKSNERGSDSGYTYTVGNDGSKTLNSHDSKKLIENLSQGITELNGSSYLPVYVPAPTPMQQKGTNDIIATGASPILLAYNGNGLQLVGYQGMGNGVSVADFNKIAGTEFLSDIYFAEIADLYQKILNENNKPWNAFDGADKIAAAAVINRMMGDLEKNPSVLVNNRNFDHFFDTFDNNIRKLDSITERMHFFRNTLNSYSGAPTQLEDMIDKAAKGEWSLFMNIGTEYHRYNYGGIDGALNVKFVSADDRFEAVYNTGTGKVVTDAANMGTYNYVPGSVLTLYGHNKYDVEPWKEWGNDRSLSYADIMKLQLGHGTKEADANYKNVEKLINERKDELKK